MEKAINKTLLLLLMIDCQISIGLQCLISLYVYISIYITNNT